MWAGKTGMEHHTLPWTSFSYEAKTQATERDMENLSAQDSGKIHNFWRKEWKEKPSFLKEKQKAFLVLGSCVDTRQKSTITEGGTRN